LINDAAKSSLVVHRDIGQHLAVDLDGSLFRPLANWL
jgi:formate dehydrogenase assembly factor FdhD